MADDRELEEAGPPAKRGEAAWKAEKDRVAARNSDARKVGKQEREAGERAAAKRRRTADLLERAGLRDA